MPHLSAEEWDFSRLVDRSTEEQTRAWNWEMGRGGGNKERPWLSLRRGEKPPKSARFQDSSFREISSRDFYRFQHEFSGKPTSRDIVVDGGNPVDFKETTHVLLIRWKDFRAEQIVAELAAWARAQIKKKRVQRLRSGSPMSDLWELSCYRLRDRAGLTFSEVATTLNVLPKFKARRSAFDHDAARKAFANAKAAIEDHSHWMRCLAHMMKPQNRNF